MRFENTLGLETTKGVTKSLLGALVILGIGGAGCGKTVDRNFNNNPQQPITTQPVNTIPTNVNPSYPVYPQNNPGPVYQPRPTYNYPTQPVYPIYPQPQPQTKICDYPRPSRGSTTVEVEVTVRKPRRTYSYEESSSYRRRSSYRRSESYRERERYSERYEDRHSGYSEPPRIDIHAHCSTGSCSHGTQGGQTSTTTTTTTTTETHGSGQQTQHTTEQTTQQTSEQNSSDSHDSSHTGGSGPIVCDIYDLNGHGDGDVPSFDGMVAVGTMFLRQFDIVEQKGQFFPDFPESLKATLSDKWGMRCQANLYVPRSGKYKFTVMDGEAKTRVTIGSLGIINNSGRNSGDEDKTFDNVQEGNYALQIDYMHRKDDEIALELKWKNEDRESNSTVIPAEAFLN